MQLSIVGTQSRTFGGSRKGTQRKKKGMTETSHPLNFVTSPSIKMIKGYVTETDGEDWITHRFTEAKGVTTGRTDFGHAMTSFAVQTEGEEVLIVLPRKTAVKLTEGTEVWILGKEIGHTRFEATMIFLPRLQRMIDFTGSRIPTRRIIGLGYASLIVWLANIGQTIMLSVLVLPLFLTVIYVLERRPVKSKLVQYSVWELVEQRAKEPHKLLSQLQTTRPEPRGGISVILFSVITWILATLATSTVLYPAFEELLVNPSLFMIFWTGLSTVFAGALVYYAMILTFHLLDIRAAQ